MNILVNASNLKAGGGLQVADSICRQLYRFKEHHFYVVLSSAFTSLKGVIEAFENTEVDVYDIKNNLKTILFGREEHLDSLLEKYKIDCVLTVFGPSRWIPRCPHLCGFARGQIIFTDSPFYQHQSIKSSLRRFFRHKFIKYLYKREAKYLYSENPFVTRKIEELFVDKKAYTVSNYYNQVFDSPAEWEKVTLLPFDGIRIVTIATAYPHKNLKIAIPISEYLKKNYPLFKFKFIFTIQKENYPDIPKEIEDCFEFVGTVSIAQCPSLYSQCNVSFQPTLMECFTATYPESMKMDIPIVTTDLNFAHALCGEAAHYYDALNASSAAEALYKVATDKSFSNHLVEEGKEQLKKFDNYEQRANKIIQILEGIVK